MFVRAIFYSSLHSTTQRDVEVATGPGFPVLSKSEVMVIYFRTEYTS